MAAKNLEELMDHARHWNAGKRTRRKSRSKWSDRTPAVIGFPMRRLGKSPASNAVFAKAKERSRLTSEWQRFGSHSADEAASYG
jgi:hypothetical protein